MQVAVSDVIRQLQRAHLPAKEPDTVRQIASRQNRITSDHIRPCQITSDHAISHRNKSKINEIKPNTKHHIRSHLLGSRQTTSHAIQFNHMCVPKHQCHRYDAVSHVASRRVRSQCIVKKNAKENEVEVRVSNRIGELTGKKTRQLSDKNVTHV